MKFSFRFHYNHQNHMLKGKVLLTYVSFDLGNELVKQVTEPVLKLSFPNSQPIVCHTKFK